MSDDFYSMGSWLAKKMNYHKQSNWNRIKRKQVLQGEIWNCDFGFNIGEEKNKKRPVVVISNNRINRTGKIIVAPITDAKGKMNVHGFPQQNSWYLLYSTTTNPDDMFSPTRRVPTSAVQYSCLYKDSIIQCEELRSVSKSRLEANKIHDLDPSDLDRLKTKIKKVFDIL